MQSPVLLLAGVAYAAIAVSQVAASPLNERFTGASSVEQIPENLAQAKRVTPVQPVEAIQRSDAAALLIPQGAAENVRPTVSNTVDSNASLGRITTSSVSKLVLNSVGRTNVASAPKSGETNPLLEALRWRGANSSQVGVPDDLWCADFMNFILSQTGQNGTGSRAARSFLKYGKQVDGPRVGAIVVFTRGSNGQSGHVGIVRGTDGDGNPIVISGNHGHKVAESVYPKAKVLGYFMPPNMEKVKPETLNAIIAAQK